MTRCRRSWRRFSAAADRASTNHGDELSAVMRLGNMSLMSADDTSDDAVEADARSHGDDQPVDSAVPPAIHADAIVRMNIGLSAVFVVTAAYAAAVFDTTAQWAGAITALVLFAIGVVAFLWGFWNAVQRSRTEEISVGQLFFLAGPAIPSPVRRAMNAVLAIQVVTALVTTLARPNGPEGRPGSSLAVGFLVPMLGLGLNGLWAAYHARFAPRRLADDGGS